MKIGILLCDDVQHELRIRYGNYDEMLAAGLGRLLPGGELPVYRVVDGELPPSTTSCDAWVITGSRHGVYDDLPWIAALEDWVVQLWQQQRPLIGVCFGHQLMAQALGGEVRPSSRGWGVGLADNEMVARQDWMQPWQDRLSLLVSHQDQVIHPPRQARLLARSEFCPYFMLQYGHHFLGIQGHPEFCKGYSRDLMLARRGRIPADRLERGLDSLRGEADSALVLGWMVAFVRQALAHSPTAATAPDKALLCSEESRHE